MFIEYVSQNSKSSWISFASKNWWEVGQVVSVAERVLLWVAWRELAGWFNSCTYDFTMMFPVFRSEIISRVVSMT